MNLARDLQRIRGQAITSPWAGHEHYRGYAVMLLPFSSGHFLGLRVFPENDFAPYVSVWHRDPGGSWSIYNDGPSLDTTCPRWWGPALDRAELTRIDLTWTGPNALRVVMETPRLDWTLSLTVSPLLRALNAAGSVLPLWAWRAGPSRRVQEWAAKRLVGLGDLRFSFVTPNGQKALIRPRQMYDIESSQAVWEGDDLGAPVQLPANPTIGDAPLPVRPSFVVGEAYAEIADANEYRRTRDRVQDVAWGEQSRSPQI